MEENSLNELIGRYLDGTASAMEKARIERWYQEMLEGEIEWPLERPEQTAEVKAALWVSLAQYAAKHSAVPEEISEISGATKNTLEPRQVSLGSPARKWWPRVAIAAMLVVLLGAGLYSWLARTEKKEKAPLAKTGIQDIPPGHEGALLTLADGSVVSLDSVEARLRQVTGEGSLALAQQGGNEVNLSMSGLVYRHLEDHPAEQVYNSLVTPNGRQYNVTLADGTHVWLNAGTRLYFPTDFSGAERRVKLSGEAYFEVAKDPSRPFIVETGAVQVKVLGTHFNICNYEEENAIKTTLLEGAVQVRKGAAERIIHPGQQAVIDQDEQVFDVKQVDTDGVIAWKNGYFHFEHADIASFMRQMARWYDLKVHFEQQLPGRFFSGEIERNQPFSNVVDYLRNSGVKVRMEGHEVTIE